MARCHYCDRENATMKVNDPGPKVNRVTPFVMWFCGPDCKNEFEYSCWKGTAGPGKQLKEIIKEHNENI